MTTVVLTGVSRGLGRAMAVAFADAGCRICGCSRSQQAVNDLQAHLGDAHLLSAIDVACDESVCRWAKQCLERFGPPDFLINNAGLINASADLWEVPAEEFDTLMAVNVNGTANVIRHFVPTMVARRHGVIVNFSSGWGRSVAAKVAPYCATKWAIEGLTRALAEELPSPMAAVPLNPGIINTEMLKSCFGPGAESYPTADEWAARAVSYIFQITSADSGQPLSVPGG